MLGLRPRPAPHYHYLWISRTTFVFILTALALSQWGPSPSTKVKATEAIPQLQQSVLIQGMQRWYSTTTQSSGMWCHCEATGQHLCTDGSTPSTTVKATEAIPQLQQSVLIQGMQRWYSTTTQSSGMWCLDCEATGQHLCTDGSTISGQANLPTSTIRSIFNDLKPDLALQKACKQL